MKLYKNNLPYDVWQKIENRKTQERYMSPIENHMGLPGQPSSTTTKDAPACEKKRLTDAGRRGLEAASRSAF